MNTNLHFTRRKPAPRFRLLSPSALAALLSLSAATPGFSAHVSAVAQPDGCKQLDFASWLYDYDVSNAAASANEINCVQVSKTPNAPVKDYSSPNFWAFENRANDFYWGARGIGDDIDPGAMKSYRAVSHRMPVPGFLTTWDDGGPRGTSGPHNVCVPDSSGGIAYNFRNAPGGEGTFNVSTGLWDYSFILEAGQDAIPSCVIVFDEPVDLVNIAINRSGWDLLHIGYEQDDPWIPGFRTDPLLRGVSILYHTSTGSTLANGETVIMSLSSTFSPQRVGAANGDEFWGPGVANLDNRPFAAPGVPEPGTAALLLLGGAAAGARWRPRGRA